LWAGRPPSTHPTGSNAPRTSHRSPLTPLPPPGVVQAPRFNHVAPSRHRAQSRERRAPRFSSEIDLLNSTYDELRVTNTTVDDRHEHSVNHTHRRSHSAAPMSPGDREEAEYITSRIDARGQHGEARHGITKE
jgi:hypothetical protein